MRLGTFVVLLLWILMALLSTGCTNGRPGNDGAAPSASGDNGAAGSAANQVAGSTFGSNTGSATGDDKGSDAANPATERGWKTDHILSLPDNDQVTGVPFDHLSIIYVGDTVHTLNPLLVQTPLEQELALLVFAAAGRWSNHDGALEPWLAERIEFGPDNSSATVELKEGLRWSDGTAMNADTFVRSGNDFYAGQSTPPAPLVLSDGSASVEWERLGENRFRVAFGGSVMNRLTSHERRRVLSYALSLPPLPLHVMSTSDILDFARVTERPSAEDRKDTKDDPAGHLGQVPAGGPYKPATVAGMSITLERNPMYPLKDTDQVPLPYAATVEVKIVPKPGAIRDEFLADAVIMPGYPHRATDVLRQAADPMRVIALKPAFELTVFDQVAGAARSSQAHAGTTGDRAHVAEQVTTEPEAVKPDTRDYSISQKWVFDTVLGPLADSVRSLGREVATIPLTSSLFRSTGEHAPLPKFGNRRGGGLGYGDEGPQIVAKPIFVPQGTPLAFVVASCLARDFGGRRIIQVPRYGFAGSLRSRDWSAAVWVGSAEGADRIAGMVQSQLTVRVEIPELQLWRAEYGNVAPRASAGRRLSTFLERVSPIDQAPAGEARR